MEKGKKTSESSETTVPQTSHSVFQWSEFTSDRPASREIGKAAHHLFEVVPLLQGQRVGLRDDGHDVHHLAESPHELHIQRSEAAGGANDSISPSLIDALEKMVMSQETSGKSTFHLHCRCSSSSTPLGGTRGLYVLPQCISYLISPEESIKTSCQMAATFTTNKQ